MSRRSIFLAPLKASRQRLRVESNESSERRCVQELMPWTIIKKC